MVPAGNGCRAGQTDGLEGFGKSEIEEGIERSGKSECGIEKKWEVGMRKAELGIGNSDC
jgi:hypothetical protein